MKTSIRRVMICLCITMICVSIASASGGTSTASITSSKDGAFGPWVDLIYNDPHSFAETHVTNESSSTNVLWAAGQSYSGKEFCNCSAQPGKSNYEDAVDILPSRYRLVLDPSGPLATGCNGSGSFSVFDTILGK